MWWIVQPLTSDHQWNINSVQLVNVVGLCTKKGCPLRGTAPTGLLQRGSCQFRSRRAAVSFAFQQTFIPHVPEQELLLITNCILRNNSIHKQVNSIGPTKQIAITPTREQNCLT